MTTTTTTYNLTSIKQLIDLNGDKVNFEVQFKIDAKNGETFDALVVTQEMIDSGGDLNYQKAEGSIGGNIISDKGQYQNYLLLLKAEKPTEVNVTIQLKDLPPSQPESLPQQQVPNPNPIPNYPPNPNYLPPNPNYPPPNPNYHNYPPYPIKNKKNKVNWLNIIFIVIGVILVGFVGWMFYKYFTKNQIESQMHQEIDTDKITNEISKMVDNKITQIDNKLDNKLSELGSELDENSKKMSSSFGENFSTLHQQFKNIDDKVNESIVQNSGIVDKVVGKVNDNNQGLFNQVLDNNKGLVNEVLENNTGLINKVMEKQSGLITETVESTLDKASKSLLDLSSVQTQLTDISSKLDRETSPQLVNPLKTSKKDGLSSQIKNLKMNSL
jgi:hypothetical protein